MEFLPQEIDDYSTAHTSPESEVLQKLNRETWAKVMMPRMLSGHLQGAVLKMFSQMVRPSKVLEIGTYTGYSAICLADGLTEPGVLHTIDVNDELEQMVRSYINAAGLSNKIQFHLGKALEIIPQLEGHFDLVFIDADKENYLNYYKMVIDKVRSGGFIIADNVLWSGKVLHEAKANDAETKALQEYNDFIHADERVENLLLPVRDGLMIARKK
jgi:predicted O-methyltransferase YrrM